MKLVHLSGSIDYRFNQTHYSLLSTGDIYRFEHDSILLNGFTGSQKEGSANNIWLRIYNDNQLVHYPLLGVNSTSKVRKSKNTLSYYGTIENISYEILFRPMDSLWFWDIYLSGSDKVIDIIYGQDVGIAEKESVLENELYAAQYLGHTILSDENGCHVCSRQNLPQNNSFPFLQQGMIQGNAIAFSTDALQFFGSTYKTDNIPASLNGNLENKNMQFENSYIALQSEKFSLHDSLHLTFYAYFSPNHAKRVDELKSIQEIKNYYISLPIEHTFHELDKRTIKPHFGSTYSAPTWDTSIITKRYPKRILEEYNEGHLFSFFTTDGSHIVLPSKELLMERPHGNIITTLPDSEKISNRLITSTNYIYGLFNGQTVIGNTSKHKFLSTPRGLMNLLKNSGQRIWVQINNFYRLLTLPSLYEVGFNYSRWFYEIGEDVLSITSFAISNETQIVTEVKSEKGIAYNFILTNQLVMGTHEFNDPINVIELEDGLRFSSDTLSNSPYPNLHYDMRLSANQFAWSDDRIFFEDNLSQNGTLLTLSLTQESSFCISIQGYLEESTQSEAFTFNFEDEKSKYINYYNYFLCDFYVEKNNFKGTELEKLNIISRWYLHNSLIHFAVPHGLEQPGGAAWGTRDVCQGPMELFFATQKWNLAKDVLLTIFSNQSFKSKEWSQWFMFDKYSDRQKDCHGDVIFWPLKCIGEYLSLTQNFEILNELLPYTEGDLVSSDTLLSHIKLAISSIETRFLEGTHLISYAGGDWDDTLQPAQLSLKENMVSAWTQALAYQILSLLSQILQNADSVFALRCQNLAFLIKEDFTRYLIIDGICAGFICRTNKGDFVPLLHPSDKTTNIPLRLLPLTRSIIAELANHECALNNMRIIEEQLHFPDGVRLMSRPASYDGGVSHLFCRAEQAANVGREISLQYVHAHIRYIEALCQMGKSNLAWSSLFEILPIQIKDTVPNATLRQSNLYFSSSEGAFYDRYEYAKDFEKLLDGTIAVKGGWRIYSSGPGIYLHQLICKVFGIFAHKECLTIQPNLPVKLNEVHLRYCCFNADYTFCYHITSDNCKKIRVVYNDIELPSKKSLNIYNKPSACIERNVLPASGSEIHIFME